MFEQMTPDAFAAEALFLRARYPESAIVLVEGDTDLRLFQHLLDVDIDRFINCYGKERSLETIEATDKADIHGILCIVDADWGRLTGALHPSPNVVVSDFHDFEVMLIYSSALERLLIEEGSRDKIKTHNEAGRSVIEIVTAACIPLGCLRFYSHISGAALRFDGLRYRHLGRRLEKVTVEKAVKEVFDHTQRYAGLEDAATFIETFDTSAIDIRDLVCGHDLSAALGIALQSLIGSRPATHCVASELEAKLRIGFSREDFIQTSIYVAIQSWQQRNPPFRCLH
jgi:hypothetical protein